MVKLIRAKQSHLIGVVSFSRRRLAWFFLVFKNHSSTHTYIYITITSCLKNINCIYIYISWFSPMHAQKCLLWIERSPGPNSPYQLIPQNTTSGVIIRLEEGGIFKDRKSKPSFNIANIESWLNVYVCDTYILSEFCVLASIFSIMWSFFLHESGGLTRNGKKLMFHVKSALLFLFLVSISLFDIFLPSFIEMAIKASSKGWVPSWSVKVWDPDTRQARSGRVVDGSSK